jgi:hypothetical protein
MTSRARDKGSAQSQTEAEKVNGPVDSALSIMISLVTTCYSV